MCKRLFRLGLVALAITTLTGCESIPMPTGASMPEEDEIWGSAGDSPEGEGQASEEKGKEPQPESSAE
mgnify:CR=1 FL=1